MKIWFNKPDAVNPAIAIRFAVAHLWRMVIDLERYTSSETPVKVACF